MSIVKDPFIIEVGSLFFIENYEKIWPRVIKGPHFEACFVGTGSQKLILTCFLIAFKVNIS